MTLTKLPPPVTYAKEQVATDSNLQKQARAIIEGATDWRVEWKQTDRLTLGAPPVVTLSASHDGWRISLRCDPGEAADGRWDGTILFSGAVSRRQPEDRAMVIICFDQSVGAFADACALRHIGQYIYWEPMKVQQGGKR